MRRPPTLEHAPPILEHAPPILEHAHAGQRCPLGCKTWPRRVWLCLRGYLS